MKRWAPHAALPLATTLAACLGVGACAGLPAARTALPDALAAVTPLTLEGLLGVARGDFRLGELQGSFERRASRCHSGSN